MQVHTHTSAPDKFFVNSFIIEGLRGLVLVDTQFVLSEAQALAGKLAALGKPLSGIIITHPHPDHYNGLATILAAHPGTPVFATPATAAGIQATAEPKRAYWTPLVGNDYPQEFAFPNHVIQDGESISLDGIELRAVDFGAAECADNVAFALPQLDTVIISDLVYNRVHPWLAEGRSGKWLDALARATQLFGGARALLPGHGAAGGVDLLAAQSDYITAMREAVAGVAGGGLDAAGKAAIRARMTGLYPDFELASLIEANAEGIAGETAG
jgi:glyoxylase-like metal-dependent hydrolase (beta-lactamase superfamily II)